MRCDYSGCICANEEPGGKEMQFLMYARTMRALRGLVAAAFLVAPAVCGATDVSIVGNVGYQISGNTAVLTADKIQSNSFIGHSGTLRIELWAFANPYSGLSQIGYKLAQYVLGTLNAGYYLQNVNTGWISYARPADGTWVYSFMLTEYGSDGQYQPVAWVNFDGHMYCTNGVCSNVQPVALLSVTTQGSGTVTSSPSGISCPGTCSVNYPLNSFVGLSATPASGYSFSGWSGACTGTGACSVTLTSAKSVTATFTPVSNGLKTCSSVGLWAIDSEQNGQPGRGFTIEEQGGFLVLTVFAYDSTGKATFYQAAGTIANNSFAGELDYYSGGTSFGGPWKSAIAAGNAGQVNINFTDSNTGTITFPGEAAKAISKFNWSGGMNGLIAPTFGLWAINAEQNGQPGRGFTIEEQGSVIVLTVYSYDSVGGATFYQSAGTVSNNSFVGTLDYYSGGTAFGGPWKSATAAGQAGQVTINFTDSDTGTITFPGESPKAISKFNWGATCTGGGGSPGAAPSVLPASFTLPIMGVAASSGSAKVKATDPGGHALSYSVARAAYVGSVNMNSTTGAFTYTVPGHVSVSQDSFVVTVSNGTLSANATMTMVLAADPLLRNQWHIQNTGATAFSSTLPTPGNDMNVAGAWAQGITGAGVKVAVVDSGLQVAHEDLAANVDLASSHNFVTGTNDPSPTGTRWDHGTAVAGIIGAVAFNGKGGRGVAYNSRLRGYVGSSSVLSEYAKMMGGVPISEDNDIFNASFTTDRDSKLNTYSAAYTAVNSQFLTLRGGRGAILVNSAGNDFDHWQYTSSTRTDLCTGAQTLKVSCGNPANDERLGGTNPIIVGAINADGVKSSYSTAAASLWVSAPGGEYGYDSSYDSSATTPVHLKPAIVTTNRTGCQNAESPTKPENALDSLGANPLAPNCQYTAMMNGTSSAAPNVSGVVALMLEANPSLGSRDVKYILAKTAKKVDASQPAIRKSVAGVTTVIEQGWVTNAAGFPFSNWYGFGAVDASAAVAMAKAYTSYLPIQQSAPYEWIPASGVTVPSNSSQGFSVNFPVAAPFNTVEQVVMFFTMASTPWLPCNQIELISPSGTKSILMHYATGFDQYAVTNSRMLSNAFYGEPVNGTWTLKFYDFCPPSGTPTVVTAVPQIFFAGH